MKGKYKYQKQFRIEITEMVSLRFNRNALLYN